VSLPFHSYLPLNLPTAWLPSVTEIVTGYVLRDAFISVVLPDAVPSLAIEAVLVVSL
jgi:hypothetical protein